MKEQSDIEAEKYNVEFSNLDRVINFILTLMPSQEEVDVAVELKNRLQAIMYEPHLLFRYKKDWLAFLIAFRLYNNYNSKSLKEEDAKRSISTIRLYDKKFAEGVESILHLVDKSNDEVEYLARYRNDVANWHRYDDTYLIDFFVRRISLFLGGGVEGEVKFMGLYKDFGDSKLRRDILSNNAIRNLWLYHYQLKYVYQLIGMCLKAQKSDEWTGFYGKKGFWTDFKKHVKAFKKGYGNSDFAERLREKRKETGNELPQYWGGEWKISNIQDPNILHQRGEVYIIVDGVYHTLVKDGELPKLLRELQDHMYHKQRIMLPAAEALQSILKAREYVLKEDFIKNFSRILRKKKKLLLKELSKDIGEFLSQGEKPLSIYAEFLGDLNEIIGKINFWYINKQTGNLHNAAQKFSEYARKQLRLGNFLNNLIDLVRTDAADTSRVEAKRRIRQYERFEHLTEEDFAKMEELIKKAQRAKKELDVFKKYLELQFTNKYTKASISENVFVDLKNKDFRFSYIRAMLKRLH